MKRIVLIIIVLFLFFGRKAEAQRYLPHQRGVELRFGTSNKLFDNAFYGGLALSTYTEKGNRWVFGFEYLNRQNEYKSIKIPIEQFTAEGGYYYKLLSDGSKTFFLSTGASAMAGYELINSDKKKLFDGATITSKSNFLYGGAFTVELETFLSNKVVLLLNVRERVLFGSSINKFRFQVGTGVKFIIN